MLHAWHAARALRCSGRLRLAQQEAALLRAARRAVRNGRLAATAAAAGHSDVPFQTRWRDAWARHTHGVLFSEQERPLLQLQVALELEAESGYANVLGSRGRFSGFAASQLAELLGSPLAQRFEHYDALSGRDREMAVHAAAAEAAVALSRVTALNVHQRAARARAAASGPTPQLASLLTEPGWRAALSTHVSSASFASLQAFLHAEWSSGAAVFPPAGSIFEAFNACPLAVTRVVLVGQDPYHGAGQACGLAFSVEPGVALPSSLRNILSELRADLGVEAQQNSGSLRRWAASGVLLLNTALTVREGEANSHASRGWEAFTDAAFTAAAAAHEGVVFILWGRAAASKAVLVPPERGHTVLTAAHPSGLSAHRGFFGCRHFSKANAALAARGAAPVDWRL